jgi:hypothetical protein
MSEHARLAEIEKEYESMGCSRQWVDEYVRMSVFYPDPAMASENGRFLMLPPGTLPHKIYTEKLESLVKSMEKAEERAAQNMSDDVNKDEYVKRFGIRAYEQEMNRKAELRKHQLTKPKEMQQELRNLLTKFKPIDAKAFHEKINALIKEEIRLLVNVRILEATAFESFY